MNDHAANCPVGGNFACTCGYESHLTTVAHLETALRMLRGHLVDYIPPNRPWKGPEDTAVEYIDSVLRSQSTQAPHIEAALSYTFIEPTQHAHVGVVTIDRGETCTVCGKDMNDPIHSSTAQNEVAK